ncbi:Furin-like protease 1 isoform 2 [Schistosoma japonicum]|uniref:Furin-like protease 1 isoform 2 n=1 Tax=Schistosoma japonicum TaxID=6182 RepID=A0A4Z2D6Y2_SCHJA|nr:Furin-like protease 1 isoform 2 [Schistosoma japonicum]
MIHMTRSIIKKSLLYTPYWAVEIKGGEKAARTVAEKYGFLYLGEILPGIYHFKHNRISKRSLRQNSYYHDQLANDEQVVWMEQQVAKVRVKRDVHIQVSDPKWPQMWYLNRGGPGGLDMNVLSVWARGYAGQRVVVTILDDGLETGHPDLKDNYDPFASYDVNSNDDNPEPRYLTRDKTNTNRHGTRCAGEVAAAANNSVCGLGIAYRARIGGVRMLDGDVTDAMESRSLNHQLQHIDVYSASWGPEDDGKTVDGPGKLAQMAFRNGVQMGRRGLGSIFVWASGNGGTNHDNCNCDGYTSSIYTLGVGSVSEHGSVPWYAELCSSTLAVTYSSGGRGERGVITIDLNHTCTDNHSGTSASAPLAAGICALTLSANPNLTWRDLQYLVVYTARPDGLYSDDWHVNGVGRRVSHAFGYGLMDAAAMVDLALNWTSVPPQRVCEAQAPMTGSPITIRQMSKENLALTTDGCESAAVLAGDLSHRVVHLEHVQAKVTLSSTQRGEIELWLTSPAGTVSQLLSKRPKDIDVAGFHAWPFMSVHYWGELANGTWKLTVKSGNAVVSIHDWSLILYGTNIPPPSVPSSSHRRGVRQLPRNQESNPSARTQKSWVNPQKDKLHPSETSQQPQQKSIQTSKHYSLDSPILNPSNEQNGDHYAPSENQNSYPYPPFYYLNNQNSYRYWPTWNSEYHSLSSIQVPPPHPLPPPPPPIQTISVLSLPSSSASSSPSASSSIASHSLSSSSLHDSHSPYFPQSSIPFSSTGHSSTNRVLDESNPSIDFDLPPLVVQSNDLTHIEAPNTIDRNGYSEKELSLSQNHGQYSVNQEDLLQRSNHRIVNDNNNNIDINSKKVLLNAVYSIIVNPFFLFFSIILSILPVY